MRSSYEFSDNFAAAVLVELVTFLNAGTVCHFFFAAFLKVISTPAC